MCWAELGICWEYVKERASLVAQMVKNLPAMQETWVPTNLANKRRKYSQIKRQVSYPYSQHCRLKKKYKSPFIITAYHLEQCSGAARFLILLSPYRKDRKKDYLVEKWLIRECTKQTKKGNESVFSHLPVIVADVFTSLRTSAVCQLSQIYTVNIKPKHYSCICNLRFSTFF